MHPTQSMVIGGVAAMVMERIRMNVKFVHRRSSKTTAQFICTRT